MVTVVQSGRTLDCESSSCGFDPHQLPLMARYPSGAKGAVCKTDGVMPSLVRIQSLPQKESTIMKMWIATIIPKAEYERTLSLPSSPPKTGKAPTRYRVTGQKVMASNSATFIDQWIRDNSQADDIVHLRRWNKLRSR